MRVLLADPDQILAEAVQRYLWNWGHEAEIAGDALECMSLLCELEPDVLVLHQGLLGGGSDGVLAQMERDALLSELPVILTVDREVGNEPAAWPRMAVACLVKPYRLGDLLTQVSSVNRLTGAPMMWRRRASDSRSGPTDPGWPGTGPY